MQENEKDKRLEKQLDFIREIDKEKEIFRQTYLADASRKENDASGGRSWREHSVKLSQILGRNKRTALGSEKIWDYAFNNILKKHVESGNIIDDEGIFSAEAGASAKAGERNGR